MILKLENVDKAFHRQGERIEALRGVSLELGRGDFVGIFGPGGAGKTTLLKIAAGLTAPDKGSVSYRGQLLS